MAKLARLIQGQDVHFDTHQSGDQQPTHWQDLHLEKRLHKGGKIHFHFFGDRDPMPSERISGADTARIVKEVRRTLEKNPQLREQLAETIVSQLNRFRSGAVTLEQAQEAARNIASAFDLGPEFVASAVVHAKAQISMFTTLHPGRRPGTVVEIVQSGQRVSVQKPKESWAQWRGHAL
jgi:hypothetical protein